MRRVIFILIAIFTFPLIAAERPNELPKEYSGTMMPFDFSRLQSEPIWPDSLKPVYVAHVARHGARYISSAKKLEKLQDAITKAASEGTLTKEGRKFSSLLKRVEDITGNQWGLLSEVGKEEERRLASDLYALLPGLLRKVRVKTISTYVPRVVMTMYEFNHTLTEMSNGISITASEGKEFSPLLRCFTADTAYAAYRDYGDWKSVSERLMDSIVSPEPARRILGASSGLTDKKLRSITLDMYDVLQSLSAFGMSAPTDQFMSADEYQACWKVDNLEHYLRNCITPLSSLAGEATAPLLARIISDADAALGARLVTAAMKRAAMSADEKESYGGNFYFGHAETLMPLLSLMQVEGCWSVDPELYSLSDRWRDYEIVPLGASIDIVLLESPTAKVYATLRHNGRFVAPIPGNRSEIVEWNAYRTFLISRILNP